MITAQARPWWAWSKLLVLLSAALLALSAISASAAAGRGVRSRSERSRNGHSHNGHSRSEHSRSEHSRNGRSANSSPQRVHKSKSYSQVPASQGSTNSPSPPPTTPPTAGEGIGATGGESISAPISPPLPVKEPEPPKEPEVKEPVKESTKGSGAPTPPAPVMSVSGDTISWTAIPGATSYTLATIKNPTGSRVTIYTKLTTTSVTPPAVPGQTVNYSVAAKTTVGGPWAHEVQITYPAEAKEPPKEPEPVKEPEVKEPEVKEPAKEPTKAPEVPVVPPAPVLRVSGDTVSWGAVAGASSYTLATIRNPSGSRVTTYVTLTSTSVTPPVVPGQTVAYSVAAKTSVGGPWAQEVSITYPVEVKEPVKEPEPPKEPVKEPTSTGSSGVIIGTNDGAGWGPAPAKTILAGHITWNRVEIGGESNTLAQSIGDGFKHNLAIVGNVSDGTPLSRVEPAGWAAGVVSQIQGNPGITIAEAGNEMFLKGGMPEPVQYGRMYLAAVNALKAAGIHTPLLFNMFGSYPKGGWSASTDWSIDSEGGGWLRDAVENVPGLAAAILANGLSSHPYGALEENSNDSFGVRAVAGEEAVAQSVLGAIPPVYITEFGFSLSRCGEVDGACSQQEQASKMRSAFQVFLSDPHVAGIWVYQSHDDGTGQWGFMNNDNTTRPLFTVLSETAIAQGQ